MPVITLSFINSSRFPEVQQQDFQSTRCQVHSLSWPNSPSTLCWNVSLLCWWNGCRHRCTSMKLFFLTELQKLYCHRLWSAVWEFIQTHVPAEHYRARDEHHPPSRVLQVRSTCCFSIQVLFCKVAGKGHQLRSFAIFPFIFLSFTGSKASKVRLKPCERLYSVLTACLCVAGKLWHKWSIWWELVVPISLFEQFELVGICNHWLFFPSQLYQEAWEPCWLKAICFPQGSDTPVENRRHTFG